MILHYTFLRSWEAMEDSGGWKGGRKEGKWKCLVVKSGDERMDGAE